MPELTEQERQELMECKFDVTNSSGKSLPGKLVDVDYYIGITIVNESNHDNYLYCLIGKRAMTEKQYGRNYTYWEDHPGLYDELFQLVIVSIREGNLKIRGLDRIADKNGAGKGGSASAEICAFNQ